ncbi:thioredoxin fold domain-containing protein [Acidiferrobacter sp.]|uniref:thioredoxin fold domain-containing protein n=1 Tax=Acidiferrobacter sp. TaxID=1872107 RepID=UPI00260CD78D|nr:thioredoxin fold domain-containing protein [Acidiferrobacter sp.]
MTLSRRVLIGFVLCAFGIPAWAHPRSAAARQAHRLVLYRALAHATGITEGHGRRVVYDIFDPNCPYCHMLYERLQGLIAPYHLTLHEIPVGYLTPSSAGKAAALLEASDRRAALRAAEAHYSWKTGSSITPRPASPAIRKELATNLALDTRIVGFPLVPILVYQKTDGTIRIVNSGAPPTWALKQMLVKVKE